MRHAGDQKGAAFHVESIDSFSLDQPFPKTSSTLDYGKSLENESRTGGVLGLFG